MQRKVRKGEFETILLVFGQNRIQGQTVNTNPRKKFQFVSFENMNNVSIKDLEPSSKFLAAFLSRGGMLFSIAHWAETDLIEF